MKMKNNFSYLIEKYNAGEMDINDKQDFEHKMETDGSLRSEVKLRKVTDDIIADREIISLRNKLTEIERNRAANKGFTPGKSRFFWKYAAAVVMIMVLFGSIRLYTGQNMNADEIIRRYYKTYEPPASSRSGSSVQNEDFEKALGLYNTREYGKAALLFSRIAETNPGDMRSEFLSGVSNFEDKKYHEASKSFVNVINENQNYFIETAKWYLALCYVRTNEKEKAITQLQQIRDEKGLYSSDAAKIIKKFR